MRFFARILSVIILFVLFTYILSIPVFADSTQQTTPIILPQTEQGVPNDIHSLTQSVILSMVSFLTCTLSGVDIIHSDHRCLGYNPASGKLGYVSNSTGISGMLANGIAATFTKPIQTVDYFRYLSGNFGIVKHAFAADQTGFAQLSPLMNIWIGMRNVSYVFFVIIFVGIGFAIMLRAKIDPRTVMTVENQIPKLIVALILISFSFAIAGFMLDVMWVLIFVSINLFASLDPQLAGQIGSITSAVGDSPLSLANSINGAGGFLGIAGQASGAIKDIANTIAVGFFNTAVVGPIVKYILLFTMGLPVIISCVLGSITNVSNWPIIGWFTGGGANSGVGGLDACFSAGVGQIVSTFGQVIAFLIFTIALIIALAKLLWTLLKSYSLFIVYVIFSPLMIMAGVIPGSKISFENYLRHIAAYTIVFPTAVTILLVGKVVMDAYSRNTGLVPPLLGVDPRVSSALGPLLGFAIIMLLPQSLTIVQDALQAPDVKYLPGVGQAIGAGVRPVTTLGIQQVRRAFRAKNLVEGIDEGWVRKRIPQGLKNLFYGRPIDDKGLNPGTGHGK